MLATRSSDAVVTDDIGAAPEAAATGARIAFVDDRASGAGAVGAPLAIDRDNRSGAAIVFIRIAKPGDESFDLRFLATLDWPPTDEALDNALHAAACFAGGADVNDVFAALDINAAPEPKRRALRVLVAEDNPVNRRLTERILARAGFRPHLVDTGEDALDALAHGPYDAVLLDINMPGVSGLDVVKLHRMASLDLPRIPVIALSADATVETREAAIAAGVDLYLTKPVEPHRLVDEIDRLVLRDGGAEPEDVSTPPADAVQPAGEEGAKAGSFPILDRSAIEALDAYGGPDEGFGLSILRDFVANTGDLMDEIRDAVHRGDAAAFRAAVHALRGTSGNVGADAMRHYCQDLQGMTAGGLHAHGMQYVSRLEWEYGRLRREIGRYKSEGFPPVQA